MNKQLVLIFLLGAVSGGGISAFYFSGRPPEVKVMTKTEYVPVNTNSIQNDSREITKFPEHSPEESVHDSDEVGKNDQPEENEEGLSQMDQFERSVASEQEATQSNPAEEVPGAVPEEPSQDGLGEVSHDNYSEN